MIKAVFIDIDNTLLSFDGYVKEAMKSGFKKYSLKPFEEDMFDTFLRINGSLWREIELGTITFHELEQVRWNRIFEALGISFDGPTFETYFRRYLFSSAIPVEGAFDMLDYLHGKYELCAASNGPYEQQLNRLQVGKMLPYFSHVFISGQIGFAKPSTEFFTYGIDKLNESRTSRGKEAVSASEIMIIGDSLTSDITGGINSGMKTCFYNHRRITDFGGIEPDCVIDKLEEIKNYL